MVSFKPTQLPSEREHTIEGVKPYQFSYEVVLEISVATAVVSVMVDEVLATGFHKLIFTSD